MFAVSIQHFYTQCYKNGPSLTATQCVSRAAALLSQYPRATTLLTRRWDKEGEHSTAELSPSLSLFNKPADRCRSLKSAPEIRTYSPSYLGVASALYTQCRRSGPTGCAVPSPLDAHRCCSWSQCREIKVPIPALASPSV